MTLNLRQAVLTITLVAMSVGAVGMRTGLAADEPGSRKATKRVQPFYPELARKLQLRGTVRLTAVVASGGRVTDTEVLGGHPILAAAAQEAAKQWVFQPASSESRELLVFVFTP